VPYLIGLVALGLLLLLVGLAGGTWNPLELVKGFDGPKSTSKLQWLIWTAVVIFGYVVIYSERVRSGDYTVPSHIPGNVLIALGISAGTVTLAKAVTVSQVDAGKITKADAKATPNTRGGILKDDSGQPDLSKIQLVAWTIIAAAVFLSQVIHAVQARTPPQLPDIDPSLMILMGIGHAGYLGKKLVTTSPAAVDGDSGAAPVTGVPAVADVVAQHARTAEAAAARAERAARRAAQHPETTPAASKEAANAPSDAGALPGARSPHA
jgi:hypothetical protein